MGHVGNKEPSGTKRQADTQEPWKGKSKLMRNRQLPYRVQVKIVAVTKKPCAQGFKVGDTWIIEPFQNKTPDPPMCADAYNTIFASITNMRFGGVFPYHDQEVVWNSCSDPNSQLVFEIRRLPREEKE